MWAKAGGELVALPLDGVKVLDFSRFLSGPYCTSVLADMGAEVTKVERLPSGDDARGLQAARGRLRIRKGAQRPDHLLFHNRIRPDGTLCAARGLRHNRPGGQRFHADKRASRG